MEYQSNKCTLLCGSRRAKSLIHISNSKPLVAVSNIEQVGPVLRQFIDKLAVDNSGCSCTHNLRWIITASLKYF